MKPNPVHSNRDIFHIQIDEAIMELIQLEKNGFYNTDRISWWNLKYQKLDQYCYEYRHTDSCVEGMSCGCAWNSPESSFHDLYSKMEEILDLFMMENFFKLELERLESYKADKTAINQWLYKNEKYGTEDFIDFWIEWYEEEKNIIIPFIGSWNELGIKFRGEEWKSTIEFLRIFNDLYWGSNITNKG